MKYLILLISLLVHCSAFGITSNEAKVKAEKILKKLYITNGNFIKGAAPDIIIKEEKGGGASYTPRHQIHLDLAVVEMCEGFGKDSDDALAYILGHELAHSYQKHAKSSSFWGYYLHKDCTKNEERSADVYGIFNAYLAGFKTVDIVPSVIEGIYDLYDLQDNLTGYPPKTERMTIVKDVVAKVEDLKKIYESASYLSSIGQYDLAAASYQHILQYYQGREVYNNLGVCYALQAMNFTNKDYDLYLYPLELDWLTRMNKPKTDRGGAELSVSEKAYRSRLLSQALEAFEEVAKLDKQYFTAEINMLCVLNLMGDYLQTIRQYGILNKTKMADYMGASAKQKEKARMAVAIAKAHLAAERQAAHNIWADLSESEHKEIVWQAQYNLRVLEEGKCAIPDDYSCREPFPSKGREDGVMLHRITNYDEASMIILDETAEIKVGIETYPNSIVFRFYEKGKPHSSLQQIFKPKSTAINDNALIDGFKLDVVTTSNGYLLGCRENKSVFLMSSENQPLQWAKYYVHKKSM